MTVIVIGTGIMGTGVLAGLIAERIPAVLLGRDAQHCASAVRTARELAARLGAKAPADASPVEAGLIQTWSAWDDASIVIENVAEDLALKQALFRDLDARVPAHIPLGSNSSSFGISKIAAGLATRRRMFGAHYFMPAEIVPLVEVVLGADSDPALGRKVCELFTAMNKNPVLVKKDIAGFLANRMQHALMREALSLIDAGIASPEDVDLAVRYSFGFRYAAAGPILQKEISGWDTTLRAGTEIYPTLSNTATVPACLAGRVAQGKIGMKSGEGFLKWTPETIAAAKAEYERKLKAAFALL
jgi:3-hydroxybutyryl-CoA dehydrogenase